MANDSPNTPIMPVLAGTDLEEECWRLYIQGHSTIQAARICQVSVDLAGLATRRAVDRKEATPLLSVRAHVEKLVDEVNLLRQAAWLGWERSQRDKVKTTDKETVGGPGGGRSDSTTATERQAGDAAFLRVIADCNKREAALRGIEKPSHTLFQLMQTNIDIDALLLQVEAANANDGSLPFDHDAPSMRRMNEVETP